MNLKAMRKFVLLIVAACLVSCATPEQMRKEGPFLTVASKKPSQAVAMCISSKWENLGLFRTAVPVNMRMTEQGYTVSVFNAAISQTDYLLDIANTSSGSTTKYYKRVNSLGSDFDDAVKSCQ